MQLGDPVMMLLERAIDVSWFRQQLIADNIANADTPHYKRQEIDFKKTLEKALAKGEAGTANLEPVFLATDQYSGANNGNNVDIENEMAQQAMNLLLYDTLTRLEADQLAMLRTAILEGEG